jgi:hypothetical protein
VDHGEILVESRLQVRDNCVVMDALCRELGKDTFGCCDHALDLAVKDFCATEVVVVLLQLEQGLIDLDKFKRIVSTVHSSPLLTERLEATQKATGLFAFKKIGQDEINVF